MLLRCLSCGTSGNGGWEGSPADEYVAELGKVEAGEGKTVDGLAAGKGWVLGGRWVLCGLDAIPALSAMEGPRP